MKTITIENDVLDMVVAEMAKSELFGQLGDNACRQIAGRAQLNEYQPDEVLFEEQTASDSFLMVIAGEVAVTHLHISSEEVEEISRMTPYSVIGEMGLVLNMDRTATVKALKPTRTLKFEKSLFDYMFDNFPAFGRAICQSLAQRLQQVSSFIPLPGYDIAKNPPSREAMRLLPMQFIIRHRALPLKTEGNVLHVGFVNDPTPRALSALRRFLPSMELRLAHIENNLLDDVLRSTSGLEDWAGEDEALGPDGQVEVESKSPRLDELLKRVVEEGASDLHLSAGHHPHWRIDGDMAPIEDTKLLGKEEVWELLLPVMHKIKVREFEEKMDVDFVYPLPGVARFRVNAFRDDNGISAVFRFIPSKILSFEQLGLPQTLIKLANYPKGLVLVTGPTGSGKSTTLAAMINHINRTRRAHIITMEDPIEFTYESDKCLINQREVGMHAKSFARALRSALREDPDIVLVGEMRDLETISLALETANTGHLVFGTLHTSTAASTMARIVDSFPPEQRDQVRASLTDSLKGVIAQTLCKRIGGGRIAALEILIVNVAVANLIREEKINQIESAMQTGKALGNRLMNEELAKLVKMRKIEREEAFEKALDKADLKRRIENLYRPVEPQ
jgi:twitching motility protein PilT